MKELSVDKKYQMLLDQSILQDAINYAFHKELGAVDQYYDFYLAAQKRMLPSYLGAVFGIMKTITPGRTFKRVMNQVIEIMQMHHPLSKLGINWISDREVSIDVTNCQILRKTQNFAEKAGLDINPVALCGFEARFFRDIFKEFDVDMQVTLKPGGCSSIAKMT
jgi:hypothetical protein